MGACHTVGEGLEDHRLQGLEAGVLTLGVEAH